MRPRTSPPHERRSRMKTDKTTPKKKGTLRPWLVDVAVEHLR
jgi:hypothetical protein